MRDLYLDFGTFTIRIVDVMPGEDGPEDMAQTAPWPFTEPQYARPEDETTPDVTPSVEVIDAADFSGTRFAPNDYERAIIIRQEYSARYAGILSQLQDDGTGPRVCREPECNGWYYFEVGTQTFRHAGFDATEADRHSVKPNANDAELLVTLAVFADAITGADNG